MMFIIDSIHKQKIFLSFIFRDKGPDGCREHPVPWSQGPVTSKALIISSVDWDFSKPVIASDVKMQLPP